MDSCRSRRGPPVARAILENIPVSPEVVTGVFFIISKHHTFSAIDDIDFQLLSRPVSFM